MAATIQSEKASVVVLGHFNAAIFHPLWFSERNLIRKEEAETAEIQIVHHDATIFTAEWLNVQITADKAIFGTGSPAMHRPLRDVVYGAFSLLEHTPIKSFGFNCDREWQFESEEERDAFHERLAPPGQWRLFSQSKLHQMQVVGEHDERPNRKYRVQISQGASVQNATSIALNEHYDLVAIDGFRPTENVPMFLRTLETEWETFLPFADRFQRDLLVGPRD